MLKDIEDDGGKLFVNEELGSFNGIGSDEEDQQILGLQSDGRDMSLSGKEGTNTESGAGTLVGDNMALGDDPFNGRSRGMSDMFNSSKPAGRASMNLN